MALDVYISKEEIHNRVQEIGEQISWDYEGEDLYLIGVLSGASVFIADLIRTITIPLKLTYIAARSDFDPVSHEKELHMLMDVKDSLQNKSVLLVDDIIDSGFTLNKIIKHILAREPKSFKVASLLLKPAKTEEKINVDYYGFEIENKFVVGYGMDLDGRFRELPYIADYTSN